MLDGYVDAFSEFLRDGRREALVRYLANSAEPAFLDVYRNGFIKTCTDVLRASYPSVAALVGEECFKALARRHVDAYPPRDACLAEYGEAFPAIADATREVHGLAYLGAVARLDRAWTEVYFADDDEGAGPGALAALDENAITRLRGRLAPRARLLALEFSALDAWARLRRGALRAPVAIARERDDVLMWRTGAEVAFRALESPELALVAGIAAGKTCADAARDALELAVDFDVSAAFAALLSERVIILDDTERHGEMQSWQ